MMRSGSTLQYQLAVAISEESGRGQGIGEIRSGNFEELEKAYPEDSIIVCKLHHIKHLRGIDSGFNSGKAIGIYSFRDIRDVTTSLMNMRKTSFDRVVVETKEIPECLDNFYAWSKFPGILISQYETMAQNIPHEVERIAHHLGIQLSPEKIQEIATAHSKQNQLNRVDQWKSQKGELSSKYDPYTLLHSRHINSGESQQWKTKLTPIQLGYLESLAGEWMKTHDYAFSQPLYIHLFSQLLYSKYYISERKKIFFDLLETGQLIPRLKTKWQKSYNSFNGNHSAESRNQNQ